MAILLVYVLLVAYSQSFMLPLVAMAAIPLALIGVFPGHWLLDSAFSGPSLIGVVPLAGIVMRNSLLIMDFSMERIERGVPHIQAIIDAAALRLPTISLTALTVVIGSTFVLPDPVFRGLAVSLIFGTISATLLTPLAVPILFYRFVRQSEVQYGHVVPATS